MRSLLADRLGVQKPRILHLPPDVVSLAAAEEAIELADAYGLCDGHPLDESQRITLRAALGERADGSWAATQVGDFKGRQGGGKSDSVAARELAGLILFGEPLIIHTAHEFPTANESFLRLVALFENYDDLRRRVRRILYGNGTQSINLVSGQRILYKARTGGAGRGFTKAALVVYDEAQHLQAEHVAASGPARLAYPNSQSWYAGSGGLATSATAWRLRRRALSGGGGRLAYCEGTAEDVSVDPDGRVISTAPDPTDRDGWAQANPGLARWVTEESMAGLFDELGPELFARECMCVWDPEPGGGVSVIPVDAWQDCASTTTWANAGTAYALDASPDGRSCAISASDGTHVEIVKHATGIGWVVEACVAKRARFTSLVLDPAGPAGQLVAPLEEAGLTLHKVTVEEAKAACAQFLTAVTDKTLVHLGQPELNDAVGNADRRDVGDGGWLWSRKKSSVDISPLYAATLARWAAQSLSGGEADFFLI